MAKTEATVEELVSMIERGKLCLLGMMSRYPRSTPHRSASYIMDSFPIVKRKDEAKHGEYRTQRLVLEAWDRLEMDSLFQTVSSQSPRTP